MAEDPFLSIVVPFHNSAHTCVPLLEVLAGLDPNEAVELIFVDDGSTDATLALLHEFARQSRTPVHVLERSRGGPGAARNSGLDRATGKFIWFVDSDDTIDLSAITHARKEDLSNLDLIAWDWEHPKIIQRLVPGLHFADDGPASAEVLDPIVCNWFSRSFLQRTKLRFPEFCFYEATPLEFFVLPLLVRRYRKIDFPAYTANTTSPSITRRDRDWPGHCDCLQTIPLGMAFVAQAELDSEARASFETAFIRTFLWYVIGISPLPGRSWLHALRVMRQYRYEAKRLAIVRNPLPLYPGRFLSAIVIRLLWLVSGALPSQALYFQQLRRRVWTRDILWEAPEMPARFRQSAPSVHNR